MQDGPTFAAGGFYPERAEAAEPFGDRLLGEIEFVLHRASQRWRAVPAREHAEVGDRAGSLKDIPDLRARLRREGFTAELVGQCAALYRWALACTGCAMPSADVEQGARVLLKGGMVQFAGFDARVHALGLAAIAMAIRGTPVHLLAASDERAKRLHEQLAAPMRALAIEAGCIQHGMNMRSRAAEYARPVVCAAQREIAADYLRDRLNMGASGSGVLRAVERLAGDAPGEQLLLRGLHCALVEEADNVLLDEIRPPLVISTEADESGERLNYEQALEFARALEIEEDFTLQDAEARLTASGAQRLKWLVQPLGGIWAGRQRGEELIGLALQALHRLRRDRDYRVEDGKVVFADGAGDADDEDGAGAKLLRRLVETKEGCRVSGRRIVLAKITTPRFMRRYLHLAGACEDASGIEREFWSLYRAKTTVMRETRSRTGWSVRVFAAREEKYAAMKASIFAAQAKECAVLVAARTPGEIDAMRTTLKAAGAFIGILSGRADDAQRRVLEDLDEPRNIAATLHPAEHYVRRRSSAAAPLHLVVGELHDARRHVAQIERAYGAQSVEILFSLEDETIRLRIPGLMARLARASAGANGELGRRWSRWIARLAQRRAEQALKLAREEAVSADARLNELLAFSGRE